MIMPFRLLYECIPRFFFMVLNPYSILVLISGSSELKKSKSFLGSIPFLDSVSVSNPEELPISICENCGCPQSQHKNNNNGAYLGDKDKTLFVHEPTDVFGFVTFEKKGRALETGTSMGSGSGSGSGSDYGSQFVVRFAFEKEEDEGAEGEEEREEKLASKVKEAEKVEEKEEKEVGKGDATGDKSLFWCSLDQLMHEILNLEKPDLVISIHDEGKDNCR